MMFVIVLMLAAVCSAQDSEPIAILRYESDGPNPDGSYKYSYETANGISAEEEGYIKNAGTEDAEAAEVRGSYKYTAPDGTLVSVTYIANENGFQPQGTHISVAGLPRNLEPTPQEVRARVLPPQTSTTMAQSIAPSEEPATVEAAEEAAVATNGETANEAEASLFRPVYRARAGSNSFNGAFRRF